MSQRGLRARLLAAGLAVVLAGVAVGEPVARPAPDRSNLTLPEIESLHGDPVVPRPRPDDLTQGALAPRPPVEWPSGMATVDIPASGRMIRVGALPVWLGATGADRHTDEAGTRATVGVLDRAAVPAAWRDSLLLDVTSSAGADATVAVGYGGFAGAVGGDWAARLRLLVLPRCALTTPDAAGCGPVELPSHNSATTRQVTSVVSLVGGQATLLALTGAPKSSAGDFTATSLQASSTWSAAGNSGTFSWNYPLSTPPSLGGPAPKISLAYSSAAVDGRSEATNNQPSWVGEGFDWWPGSVERRYKPCASDGMSGVGDLCWASDNAVLSLNGSGGELVKDDATGTWRLRNDDNSTVEHLTGAMNGDNDNEYWKITTADGVQYFFGLNRLPGYTGSAPADKTTNSAWTVPVAGNDAGEPCHGPTFATSFCAQVWRWNLDYVVDPHGNTMSLYYSPETNKYARNHTDADAVSYVRGGSLDHIDYGTDQRSGTDTANTATAAPMRVQFTPADRCLSSCWSGANPVTANWTDTPWDFSCTGSTCVGLYSPTFWTTRRLASVMTKVWNAATSAYKDVDMWTLTHTFPDPGDGTRAGLWLESVVHTGKATGSNVVGGDVALPEVNFDGVQLANRVDTVTDGKFPMNWLRLSTIWTETGGKVDIRYSMPECVAGITMPVSPRTNTLRCYPTLEEQPDHSIKTEYFHRYVVTGVTEADLTGPAPDVVTSYEYVGAPAWRHTDDDGLTPANLRTWSDYRGYGQVNTRVGTAGTSTEALTETTYFRGMHGDLDGAGGTRTVTLPAIDGNGDGDTADAADAPGVTDDNVYAGLQRRTTVFNGVESAPVRTTISEPWQSAPTASRVTGSTTTYARHSDVKTTWVGTKLAAGGWRVSRVDKTFDGLGLATQSDDQGDVAVPDDEVCIRTTYNRNTALNLLTPVARVETYALRCSTAAASAADVISDTRTSYDGQAYGAAPTKGDATTVEAAKDWSPPGGPVWLTQSTGVFDPYGRPTDVTDVRGNHTTTAYTPSSGGPVTSVATTAPLGTSTATKEPAWGVTTVLQDQNSKRTEATYDALGRTRQVWLANHVKASFPTSPSASYTYLIRNSGGVNAVTTAELNAGSTALTASYTTTHRLYDGMLRPRQTQTMSMATGNVGTVFEETKYDDQGRVVSQSQHFDAAVSPGTTLFTIADWVPKSQTATQYDRAGRVTSSVFNSSGAEQWRTSTTYGGDRVTVVPPDGGTATTTVTDARGRTVELRQYHNPADAGSDVRGQYDLTAYHFDRKGRPDAMTDNAGNVWTAQFDLLGRRTLTHDPDEGDTTTVFGDAGDALAVTDGRSQTLVYVHDALGRRTAEYAGSVAPANVLATWTFDPPGFKGQLASSSRFLNAGADEYKVKVRSYTPLYQSTGEDYTIPPSLTGLANTYTISRTYRVDGSPADLGYPAVGTLNAETVTYTYDATTGLPEQLQTNSGEGQYVFDNSYNAYGERTFVDYHLLAGAYLQRLFTYDEATHRRKQATSVRQTAPAAVDNTDYRYDKVGNISRIITTSASGDVDTQCFGYDYAQRLADAWTPAAGDCDTTKSVASLGGPAPYWHSWSFDAAGNRTSQTMRATGGDTTTTYAYPAAGTARAHSILTATTGTTVQTYGYDLAGNTACRPVGSAANTCSPASGSQALTWDAEGRLSTVVDGAGTSRYTYTADGDRLVADDATATTVYLPGTEMRRAKTTGTVTATRYFTWAGQTCAQKTTGGAVTWLIGDQQNTQLVAVAAGNQAITTRRQLPYGGSRGAAPTWPNAKGFVSGDLTAAGLTHVGAREYDPALGRFLSDDPLFDPSDPQSYTGYAYANHNPVTRSDPTGLRVESDGGGYRTDSCHYADPYANLACTNAKTAAEIPHTSVSDTTAQEQQNMSICYQMALARHTCNYDTPPTQQLAQYQQEVDEGNRQRSAEVDAAIAARHEAERRAQAEEPRGMLAVCPFTGAIAVLSGWLGFNGSACIAVDSHGIGSYESVGAAAGFELGGYLGMGWAISDGNLDDQAGWFTTYGGGVGDGMAGDVQLGLGSSGGRTVGTVTGSLGWGEGGWIGVGRSFTWTQRWFSW